MLLTKVYRRFLLEVSKLLIDPKKPRIQSVDLQSFTLLARVNEDVGRLMKLHGSYEVAETNFINRVVKPEDVCFDVGGNVGFFALLFAGLAQKEQVHCFEPIALNARMIETSAELNALNNIVVNNTAVGAKNGKVEFVISEDSAYSSMIDTKRSPKKAVKQVPLVTLDHYASEHGIMRIDILKIDVEGAEADVIRGANDLLGDPTRRPRYIIIELFEKNLNVFGETVNGVVEMIAAHGYQPNAILDNGALTPLKPGDLHHHYNFVFREPALNAKHVN